MNSNSFPKIDNSWTLFLDRDGVINRRIVGDYVRNTEQFELLDGVVEAIKKIRPLFDRIVVVTNQQGIGKGLMSTEDLDSIHDYFQEILAHASCKIDAFYHAPKLANALSIMRKPNIGMALAARRDFPSIDFSKSIMVGDSISDMQFGKNAGMLTVFVGERVANQEIIDYFVSSLASLEALIVN